MRPPSTPSLPEPERFGLEPAPTPAPSNRAERRHPTLVAADEVAKRLKVSSRTPRNWVALSYITGYVDAEGRNLHLDWDEVEHQLCVNPRMRDGRRSRYGERARLVQMPVLPVRAEVVPPEGGDA